MSLNKKIEDWKQCPNALGSESQVAVIVGEVAAALGEAIPDSVNGALKTLSLRGMMRDIASAIRRDEEPRTRPGVPSFGNVVDTGAASCGISWTEALAVLAKHLDERKTRLD